MTIYVFLKMATGRHLGFFGEVKFEGITIFGTSVFAFSAKLCVNTSNND